MNIPPESAVIRLAKIDGKENLMFCEAMLFDGGWTAVDTVLRRAHVSGRVEVGGEIVNHFADILDAQGDLIETVALDSRSYSALKNRWMKCRLERQ